MNCSQPITVPGSKPGVFLSACIAVAALATGSPTSLFAQSTSSAAIEPAFASISVTTDNSGVRSSGTRATDNEFSARNVTVRMLVQDAYGVDGSAIVGLPKWAEDEHFDIKAALDQSTAEQIRQLETGADASVSQDLAQGVLRNAFGLVAHREILDIPAYELRPIHDGPKCLDMAVSEPYTGTRTLVSSNSGITAAYITMPSLAILLSDQLAAPVQDKTGLAGGFRVDLHWSLATDGMHLHPNPASHPIRPIVEALKQQLGLTLWKGKTTQESLVVDHLDRPET